MDYSKIGLTVGIEIHQELDTKHKLFCNCPTIINKEKPDFTFKRNFRPSQSELGEIDPAALFEFLKNKTIVYQANHNTSCLVEMDEEPPGTLNEKALEIVLLFSLLCNATPVDEVQVMRKIVMDGSNTGGFQRTCIVSLGGVIEVAGNKYSLNQIALEEDAARKIDENDNEIFYRIDRLGIPLIEITTAPEIRTPNETKLVASRIGALLRATEKVRRGIGTIRQDLNISIMNGAIVEIKGVQNLGILDTIVKYEAKRQLTLIEIAEELSKREVKLSDIKNNIIDVSKVFQATKSNIIENAFRRGGKIYGLVLPGFKGLIGKELCPRIKLGTEIKDHAKYYGSVKGIIHTDEIPNYDISEKEVDDLYDFMGLKESDAAVLVADEEIKCISALKAVMIRACQVLNGVPEETRSANPDGTTRYTRPRPGAARMYPETDVKPVLISENWLDSIKSKLPEKPEIKLLRIQKEYCLNEKLASQIINSEYLGLFEKLIIEKNDPTLVAVTLTEDLIKLKRDNVMVENLTDKSFFEVFMLVKNEKTAKESILEILTWLSKNPKKNAEEAIKSLGLEMISHEELDLLVQRIMNEKSDLIKERGRGAIGPIMGMTMSKVRGKADPILVQKIINRYLKEIL
jgi:glutamyl-tRNA(Gln) amidotransferase subunit E